MATQVDRLQTIISSVGHSQYKAAMASTAVATASVGVAANKTAADEAIMIASMQGGVLTMEAFTAAELQAATAAGVLSAGIQAVNAALAPYLLIIAGLAAEAVALGVAGGVAATGFVQITRAGMEFEAALARAASVAGLTADEIDELSAAIPRAELVELGFDATQAAEGLWFLLSAGLAVQDALEGIRPAALLAAALNVELADASDLLVATMKQFGIAWEDATRVVDAFAAANAISMANFEKLQTAFRTAGPTADQFKWSLEQTLAVLIQFINAGLRGEQSGTIFRSGLILLANQSDEASKALEELGLNAARVAQLTEYPAQLIEYLAEAEWDAARAATVFGNEAMAWTIILNNGIGVYEELIGKLYESGIAQEQAAINMDTMAGALKQLAAEWSNLKEAMSKATEEWTTDMIRGLTLVTKGIRQWVEDANEAMDENKEATEDNADAALRSAEIIIKGLAQVAIAILNLAAPLAAQVGNFLMLAEAVYTIVVALAELRLGYARLRLAPTEEINRLKTELQATKDRWKEIGEAAVTSYDFIVAGSARAIKKVKETRDELLQTVRELHAEAQKALPEPPAAERPEARVPGALTEEEIKDAQQYYKSLLRYQDELGFAYQRALAVTDNRLQQIILELAYNSRLRDLASERLRVAIELGLEESEIQSRYREQENAQIALLRTQQSLRKENMRLAEEAAANQERALDKQRRQQERMFREADRQRMEAARDMQRISEGADKMHEAMQRIIGGDISRELSEAVSRLGGAGLAGRLSRSGALRATRMGDDLVVRIKFDGLTDEGRREVSEQILGDLEESTKELSTFAY